MKSSYVRDLIALLALLLLGGYYLNYREVFAALPYEDAAILMRYIDHLANGHGIVWNIGENPIDGGTDFLFLVLAAALQKAGLSTESAVLSLNLFAYFGTSLLVYFGWKKSGNNIWLSTFAAAMLLLGPAYGYIEAGFATPFFGFLTAVVCFCVLSFLQEPSNSAWTYAFGISSLLLGLCRPEGVFLSAFILAGVWVYMGKDHVVPLLKSYTIWVLGIGSIYLVWHYLYFGHLFPNPFYKKGGGALYWSSFFESISHVFYDLLRPPAIALSTLLAAGKFSKRLRLAIIPILGFTAIWVLLSNEMNYMMRFQYPVLPLFFIFFGYVWYEFHEWAFSTKRNKAIVALLLLIFVFHYFSYFSSNKKEVDGRYDVAEILNEYKDRGYSLALTEAGLLPFYSEWRCLDSWGLNDHQIALDGVIRGSYLADFKPDLIMYDAYFEDGIVNTNPVWEGYGEMIDTLQAFVEKEDFELIAKYTSPLLDHAHYYYINPRLPDAKEIKDKIRASTYHWYEIGTVVEPEY